MVDKRFCSFLTLQQTTFDFLLTERFGDPWIETADVAKIKRNGSLNVCFLGWAG